MSTASAHAATLLVGDSAPPPRTVRTPLAYARTVSHQTVLGSARSHGQDRAQVPTRAAVGATPWSGRCLDKAEQWRTQVLAVLSKGLQVHILQEQVICRSTLYETCSPMQRRFSRTIGAVWGCRSQAAGQVQCPTGLGCVCVWDFQIQQFGTGRSHCMKMPIICAALTEFPKA